MFVFSQCESVFLILFLFCWVPHVTDTLAIKPVGSVLLIPKPTTGHNPVPVVSTYNSHSFLTSHPFGVIRCCLPGCMQILWAFLVCPILASLVLYIQIIFFFLYSSPVNHTLNFCYEYTFHYVCWFFQLLLSYFICLCCYSYFTFSVIHLYSHKITTCSMRWLHSRFTWMFLLLGSFLCETVKWNCLDLVKFTVDEVMEKPVQNLKFWYSL